MKPNLKRWTVSVMMLLIPFIRLVAQDTNISLASKLAIENRELKRYEIKMHSVLDRLQGELAIARWQLDSCDNIVQEYVYQIAVRQKTYNNYKAIIEAKNTVIELDAKQLKAAKKKARLLRVKVIFEKLGIGLGSAAAAGGIVYTVMKLK